MRLIVFDFLLFTLAIYIIVNLLRCFMLAIASVRAPIAYLIVVIRIEKPIMLDHYIDGKGRMHARDRVYSVELSGLRTNLIAGLSEL